MIFSNYIQRLWRFIVNHLMYFDIDEDDMAQEHKIILPPGNYNVKLSSISITKYTSGIPGDVTLSFELENVPDGLLTTELKYIIEGNDE